MHITREYRTRTARAAKFAVALLATTVLSSPMAMAQGAKTGIDPETWTPEYINSIAGTDEVDTAGRVRQGRAARLQGPPHLLVRRPERGRPRAAPQDRRRVLGGLRRDLPEHRRSRMQNLSYNDMLDKLRTAALGDAAPMVARMPILWGVEFAAKGQLLEITLEEFGYTAEHFWPRRAQVGHLERQDLRHPDQQRDDGLHLERRDLRGGRPRSRDAARDLGRRRRLLQADQGQDRQERLRHGRPRQRRQHALPLHADALGLRRRRARRGRRRADLPEGR